MASVLVLAGVSAEPTSDIQPGQDFGGRRNPFAYYDRYPPPTRLPPSPPQPKEEPDAWPTSAHYSFPAVGDAAPAKAAKGDSGSGGSSASASASLMVGSADEKADDKALPGPITPEMAASFSSKEILGPESMLMVQSDAPSAEKPADKPAQKPTEDPAAMSKDVEVGAIPAPREPKPPLTDAQLMAQDVTLSGDHSASFPKSPEAAEVMPSAIKPAEAPKDAKPAEQAKTPMSEEQASSKAAANSQEAVNLAKKAPAASGSGSGRRLI